MTRTDIINALIALSENEKAVGDVFNVGSNQEISIRELAEKVLKLTDSKSEIKYVPYEESYGEGFTDIKRRVPDITKIKKLIGWTPKVQLDDLLVTVIDYYRSLNSLS